MTQLNMIIFLWIIFKLTLILTLILSIDHARKRKMFQKSSDVYRSLPGSIASTIPKRTSCKEEWWEEQGYSSKGDNSFDSTSIEHLLIIKKQNSSDHHIIGRNPQNSDDSCQSKNEALCVTGQVKKRTQFFEKIRELRDGEESISRMHLFSTDMTKHQDKIKYRMNYPYWDQCNKPKNRAYRHTVSNFPKWDDICNTQSKSSSFRSKTNAFTEIGDIYQDGVQPLKVKLLNSSVAINDNTFTKDTADDSVGDIVERVDKSTDSYVQQKEDNCIVISKPVEYKNSKLSVKPLIRPRSFQNCESDIKSKPHMPLFNIPSIVVSKPEHDSPLLSGRCSDDIATRAGGRCSPVSDSWRAIESTREVRSCSVCDESLSDTNHEFDADSDTSVCTVICSKDISARTDQGDSTCELEDDIMVSNDCCSLIAINNTVMGTPDLKHNSQSATVDANGAVTISSQVGTPRVVAAALKSYKDIPEELFNSLQESSVDPLPNGATRNTQQHDIGDTLERSCRKEQDWVVMQEGRRALLETSVLSNNWDTSSDGGRSSSMSSSSNSEYSIVIDGKHAFRKCVN